MLKKLTHSLSIRLFIWLLAVMVIGFALYAYQTIHNHTSALMDSVYQSAERTSDVLKKSMRYGMLINRKEDVHQIINTVSTERGVDGIRVYNKKGDIVFSSNREEVGRTVDMKAEACIICHAEAQPLSALPMGDRHRIYRAADNHRLVGLINPIENEPECYNAVCHAHDQGQKVLGVLDVKMSLAFVDKQLAETRREFILFAALLGLAISGFAGVFIYFFVRRPINALMVGTREIASGNLEYTIRGTSQDEIGQLARSFNTMTQDLLKARNEITEWSNSLEEKVKQKSKQLSEAQGHLMRMERLASLGKLSATVAHEINNPLTGALNYSFLVLRLLKNDQLEPEARDRLITYMDFIKSEVSRCGDIVKNMLIFARQTGGNFSSEKLTNLIDSGLMLVKHHMDLKEIKLEKQLECQNDTLSCDQGQIRQALVALFVNATEAMENGGVLRVITRCDDGADKITLIVEDTGCGIPEEILPNIFDPFFSTKKDGKGVGLGLAVVYGIIQRHKGIISVESQVNQGTRMIIELPRNPVIESSVNITKDIISEI